MALVNCAFALAQRGARVLMVDFDLEAPGMSHFFSETIRRHRKRGSRDSLDLLLAAKRSYADLRGASLKPPVKLNDFTIRLEPPPPTHRFVSEYQSGRLDLVPATLERGNVPPGAEKEPGPDYLDRISQLDLPGIFGPDGPGHLFGKHVGDYFRHARFRAPGDPVYALRRSVQGAYDYVLIDSRTGLNEISGLCVGPLCDSIVVCTGLNEQNVAGSRFFLEKVGLLEREKAKPYLVVVGPVPPWRSGETAERIDEVKRALASPEVIEVPYHPAAALSERVYVIEDPDESISRSYQDLAETIERARGRLAVSQLRKSINHLRERAMDSKSVSMEIWRPVTALLPGFYRIPAPGTILETILPPPPYPSGLLVQLLGGWLRGPNEAGSAAMAVAVAASYRGLTEGLVKRAAELVEKLGDSSYRKHLAIATAFFWSRLFGDAGLGLLVSAFSPAERAVVDEALAGNDKTHDLTALALRHSRGEWSAVEIDKAVTRWPSSEFEMLLSAGREARPLAWKAHYLEEVSEDAFSGRLVHDIVNNESSLTRLRKSRGAMWHESRSLWPDEMVPPGFSWPLAIAAMAAAAGGKSSVGLVLKWIELGRQIHGYAWRVMVNWKRLSEVRACPEFKAFLAEEDAAIKEVESQFSRGVWSQ